MKTIKLNNIEKLVLIVGLFLIQSVNSSIVTCQQKRLNFEYITEEDGLSQPTIKCILQDKVGFLWIGTKNGLNRYDGYRIKKYYSNPKDSTSIAGNSINAIYEDSKGNLWIPNSGGLSLYNRDLDNFINFKHNKNDSNSLITSSASSIMEDSKGQIWIGDEHAGLNLFDPINKTFKHFVHSKSNPNSIANFRIKAIVETSDGNLILGMDGGGLDIFDPLNNTFKNFNNSGNGANNLPANSVWSIIKDKKGQIWISTLGGGICLLKKDNNNNYTFENFRPKTDDFRLLKILAMTLDKEKNGLWLGTENGGLDYFDINTKTFLNYQKNEDTPNSLNNNSIQSVYIDKTGNLWVGTNTGGLNVAKKYVKNIETFRHIPVNVNSLTINAVTCFLEDKDGSLYIGTDGGGLNIYNRNTGQFKFYNTTNSNIKSDVILSINKDNTNNIYISGWENSLSIFDKKNGTFKQILKDKDASNSAQNIFATYIDRKDKLWISIGGKGLIYYDPLTKELKTFSTTTSKLASDWIFDIKEDKHGNILLGHVSGFSIFNPQKNEFTHFQNDLNNPGSISNNRVNTILSTKNNNLWLGTDYGVNKFNSSTNTFTRITETNGLTNNRVTGLIEDNKGFIWVSTDNGISKINPQTLQMKNYGVSDGFQGKAFIRRSCFINSKGEIFLGGNNGFSIFHPDSLTESPIVPEIVITDFQIFNKPIGIGGKSSPLEKAITQCNEITLSYKHSVFTFEFAAIDFTDPSQNQYAYMLEGFEKNWNYVGNKRLATYTNLDPGTYYFKIKASNNDGIWNYKEKTLKIVIKPPFWKTLWFKIAISLLTIFTILQYLRHRINRFKKQNLMLEEKVKERTLELEETTVILEEQQEEINFQKEELTAQRDALAESNQLLVVQKEQIIEQNQELDLHRNQLEILVDERTKELERALSKAEESDRLKSSFLANMSHEIRTPMNAIIGFTGLLAEKNIGDKEREEYANIITKSGQSLMVIINDILDLSLIQANQMTLNQQPLVLTDFLNEIYDTFLIETNKKNIQLILKHDCITSDLIIKTDYIRLKQVFNNLIYNALKFTTEGHIEFGVYKSEDQITFYVKDTGIGIPEKSGNSIFERFLKVESNNNTLYSGTGLGLSICKSLVELWGGNISYHSEIGKGTTFYFTHPSLQVKPIKESSLKKNDSVDIPNLRNKNILVAEDEENNFKLISVYLRKTEADVIWVHNGKEAVEYTQGNTVDLILMDIKMPIMNGLDATEIIKKQFPHIPILAQTAFAFDSELDSFKKAGIDEYLVKPINKNELFTLLKKYMLKE